MRDWWKMCSSYVWGPFFHCLGKLEPVHVDAIYPLLNGLKHVVATKIPLNVIKWTTLLDLFNNERKNHSRTHTTQPLASSVEWKIWTHTHIVQWLLMLKPFFTRHSIQMKCSANSKTTYTVLSWVNKPLFREFTHNHCLYQNNHQCYMLETPMLPMRIMIADDGLVCEREYACVCLFAFFIPAYIPLKCCHWIWPVVLLCCLK